mgnify:CR=1 FL=1
MTNEDLVRSRLADARRFLDYADRALKTEVFHHVVQFAQRAVELAAKALLAHVGEDVPHTHNLAKLVSNLPLVRALPPDQQSRLYESHRALADERLTATYGADTGVPPDAIYDRAKAEEALAQGQFVVNTVETLISHKAE